MIKPMMNVILNCRINLFHTKKRKWKITKKLKEAKTLFNSLKTDSSSVLFSEEKIDKSLLKKSKYKKLFTTKSYTFS